jgi:hypothetical protein
MKGKILALTSGILAAFFVSGCGTGSYPTPPAQYTAPLNPMVNGNSSGIDGNWHRTAATTRCTGGTPRDPGTISDTYFFIDAEQPNSGHIKIIYPRSSRRVIIPVRITVQAQMRSIQVTPTGEGPYCDDNGTACGGGYTPPTISPHTITYSQPGANMMTMQYSSDWFCNGSPSEATVNNAIGQ